MSPPSPPEPDPGKSLECFYWNEDGTKGDALIHEEILNNPEAALFFRQPVMRNAIKRGMTRAKAERLYG